MRTKSFAAAVVVVALLVATGCSSHSSHPATATIPESAEFDAADVAFAQAMIPHHRQAIEMADLVPSRGAGPEVTALARRIAAAQGPEIDTMTGWLREWDQPLPMDMDADMDMDHGSHDMGSMAMDGMMSRDDMERLGASSGAAFDRMWLEMMIAHHEGAVAMAQREVADGKYPASVELARSIIDGQTAEIALMRSLSTRLPN